MTEVRTETLRRSLDSTLEASLTLNTRVERVIEIYDTSIPADSVTGRPPLLSRTTETVTSGGTSAVKSSAATAVELVAQSETSATEIADTASLTAAVEQSSVQETASRTADTGTRGTGGLRKALAVAGAVAIMAALLAILLRFSGNPLKGFLKTIKRFFKTD